MIEHCNRRSRQIRQCTNIAFGAVCAVALLYFGDAQASSRRTEVTSPPSAGWIAIGNYKAGDGHRRRA